jgi:hypothetical protein
MRAKIAIVALGLCLASPATAALLTSSVGYSGPVIDIGAAPDPGYYFSYGPLLFSGGVTYTASGMFPPVLGRPPYGFGNNGFSEHVDMIATGLSDNTAVTLTFDNAIAVFGGFFNYAPNLPADFPFPVVAPTIEAYDPDGNLISSYDLASLAPIFTMGNGEAFQFRGIDGEGTMIKSFRFYGSYIGMGVNGSFPVSPGVPESSSWAMIIAGFGVAGAFLRRRHRSDALPAVRKNAGASA